MEAPILGSRLRTGLCQGESGSGASLRAAIASLTGCFGIQRWNGVQRRDWVPIELVRSGPNCCVLSKSDSALLREPSALGSSPRMTLGSRPRAS